MTNPTPSLLDDLYHCSLPLTDGEKAAYDRLRAFLSHPEVQALADPALGAAAEEVYYGTIVAPGTVDGWYAGLTQRPENAPPVPPGTKLYYHIEAARAAKESK